MRSYLLFATQLYAFAILRPIQAAIRQRGDRAAWFVSDTLKSYLRADETLLKTIAAVEKYHPAAVFVAGNVVPDFFPGIKVEVFHGFHVWKRDPARGHFRLRGFFDLYCTQGPDTTRHFEELAKKHGYFRVVETGWPKMDPLFSPEIFGQDVVSTPAVDRSDPRPVILLASTFTPRLSCARPLRETVAALAATGKWRWIVNFHPKMDRSVVADYQSIQTDDLSYVETDDIVPLLRQADLIVADTSSIVSEFCLQQKPAVTFRNRRPGAHLIDISDPDALAPAIETALSRPPALMTAIREYARRIHPCRDGQSSVRVLAAVDQWMAAGRRGLARKPLNLVRRLKIRKEMGYYRWR